METNTKRDNEIRVSISIKIQIVNCQTILDAILTIALSHLKC